jgi:hypothetical protein
VSGFLDFVCLKRLAPREGRKEVSKMTKAKKFENEAIRDFMFRMPPMEISALLDKGALITVIGEDDRLYRMKYEREIDGYLIIGEISKNEIINAIVEMVHNSYKTAIAIAEENATNELLKIINELQKLTPPWNA